MTLDAPRTWMADEAEEGPAASFADRYELGEELGRGGIGRVLRAFDRALERDVAVKEVRADAPPSAVRRFLAEARLTARLEHPNIVPVHDAGVRPDGSLYYVMKLVRGRTLHDAIQAAPSLAGRLALLPHVEDACQAMAYAHARGVLHRDLKPANVMLGEHGETLVVDWGIARVLEIDPPGAVEGTPAYMSPEQARGEPLDARSDVWSLGAMIFEVLAGRPPYHDADPTTLLDRVRTQPPPPLRRLAPDAPAELAAIVDKALTRDPSGRYPTATDLARDVSAWRDGRRVEAYRYPLDEALLRFARRHRAALAALALGLLVALAVAVAGVVRVAEQRDRAVSAEAATAVALADALGQHARAALVAGNDVGATAFAARSLELRDDPAVRGVLARALGVGAWRVEGSGGPEGCTFAAAVADVAWCVTPGGVRAWGGRNWEFPVVGALRAVPSPDGARVLVTAPDRLLWLDGASGALVAEAPGSAPSAVGWSPDGTRVAVGDRAYLRVWGADGEPVAEAHVQSLIQAIHWPDRSKVWVAVAAGWIFDVVVGAGSNPPACFIGQSTAAGAFHPDGRRLAALGHDRVLRLVEAQTCAVVATAAPAVRRVRALAWTRDGAWLVGGGDDGVLTTWTSTLARRGVDHLRAAGVPVPAAAGGSAVLVTTDRAPVRLVPDPERRFGAMWLDRGPEGLVLDGDSVRISANPEVYRLDPRDGGIAERRAHPDGTSGLVRAAGRAWVYSGRRLVDAADPTVSFDIGVAGRPVGDPRGHEVLLWSADGLRVVNPSAGSVHHLPVGFPVDRLVVAPDGWWIGSGPKTDWTRLARDGSLSPIVSPDRLVDLAMSPVSGRVARLREATVEVDGLPAANLDRAFTAVYWAGEDRLLLLGPDAYHLHDLDGRCRLVLEGHETRLAGIDLDADRLFTAGWDGEVRWWDLRSADVDPTAGREWVHRRHGLVVDGARLWFRPPLGGPRPEGLSCSAPRPGDGPVKKAPREPNRRASARRSPCTPFSPASPRPISADFGWRAPSAPWSPAAPCRWWAGHPPGSSPSPCSR